MAGLVCEAALDETHLSTEIELVSAATLSSLGDWVQDRAVLNGNIS